MKFHLSYSISHLYRLSVSFILFQSWSGVICLSNLSALGDSPNPLLEITLLHCFFLQHSFKLQMNKKVVCMPGFVAFRQTINCTISTYIHPKFSCKNISSYCLEWIRRKHNQTYPLITYLFLLPARVVTNKFMILFSLVAIKSNI